MGVSTGAVSDSIWESLSNFRAETDYNKKLDEEKARQAKKKSMKPSERLLAEIKENGFDLSQMEAVLKCRGNQLIISSAGSGKTTSLIFKIIYDLKTGWSTKLMEVNGNSVRIPDKIWVSTFLKSGADELAFSLRKWCNKLHCVDTSQSIEFSTLHAEFKRALTAMGKQVTIISAKENTQLLKKVLKPYRLKNARGGELNSEDISNIESALSRTRNILDSSRYEADIYEDLGLTPTLIDSVIFDWYVERQSIHQYDFEDLQEVLYRECYEKENQEVINFLADRYSFIYVDEFQDTSQIQYKLLQIYAMRCKQIVAIGDDDQTIYSWRGSDNTIITEKFAVDFNPTVNKLSINFRCPENILKAIIPSIQNNAHRFDKELLSSTEGGKVRLAPMFSYSSMISVLSDCIYNDVKNGLSVAILCRVNSDGLMPALILDKLGQFSFSISGDGMTLNSYIGRTVLSIVKLFTEKHTQPVKNALEMLTWDKYEVNNLIRVCKTNKTSFWEIDENDLAYSCPSIASILLKWKGYRKDFGDIQALRLVLQDYRSTVFAKDNQFNTVVCSVIKSVEALLDYFDYDYVEDFLFELDEINERLMGRKGKKNVKVQIATVHEFKGKEADSVYIWNDSQGTFPPQRVETSGTDLDIEEERRVHYIACTRAKKISTIIYLKNKSGRFLEEMDLDGAEVIETDSKGVIGYLNKKDEDRKNLNKMSKIVEERNKSEKGGSEGIVVGVDVEKDLEDEENTQRYIASLVPTIEDMYGDDNPYWGIE